MRSGFLIAVIGLAASTVSAVEMALNSDCFKDTMCPSSMKCFRGKCVCKEGYYLLKDSCLGGLRQKCEYDSHCIVNAYCKHNEYCQCLDNLNPSADGSECIGEVLSRIADSTCEENPECKIYGNAFCYRKTNQCQCRTKSHWEEHFCYEDRAYGENCTSSFQCYSPDSPKSMECSTTNHTCICKSGFTVDQKLRTCNIGVSVQIPSVIVLLATILLTRLLYTFHKAT